MSISDCPTGKILLDRSAETAAEVDAQNRRPVSPAISLTRRTEFTEYSRQLWRHVQGCDLCQDRLMRHKHA